jgi:peptidoglycan-associated lipoprotein
MKKSVLIMIVAMVVVVSGCSSPPARRQPAQIEDRSAGASDQAGGASGQAGQSGEGTNVYVGEGSGQGVFTAQALEDPESPLSQRIIYFDYDSNEIKPEFQAILMAHGEFLVQNPAYRVTVEGHTDERGTHEYNIGLGERRAQAVQRVLMLMGLQDNQVETISYGKQKLVDPASSEAAHALNRRAVLVYHTQ